MSDRILVPLLDGRWLALDPAAFRAALDQGQALMMAPDARGAADARDESSRSELLDADAIARLFHLKPSWLLERARLNEIPHVRLRAEPPMQQECDSGQQACIVSVRFLEIHRALWCRADVSSVAYEESSDPGFLSPRRADVAAGNGASGGHREPW